VLSFSCSQSTCVAKTRDSILASAASIPAPSGPAVIAAGNSETTLYFQQSAQFAQLRNGALQTLDWIVDGEVLSMVSMPSGIKFAVKRETGVWITALDGSILDSLPPAAAVLLLPDAAVSATENELALRRADGAEMHFECAGFTELFAMSDGWVEARSISGLFVLRTDEGHERLYMPPQPAGQMEHGCAAVIRAAYLLVLRRWPLRLSLLCSPWAEPPKRRWARRIKQAMWRREQRSTSASELETRERRPSRSASLPSAERASPSYRRRPFRL